MPSAQTAKVTAAADPIDPAASRNLDAIRTALGGSQDLIAKEMTLPGDLRTALVYIDGLSDNRLIHSTIVEPMQRLKQLPEWPGAAPGTDPLKLLREDVLSAGDIRPLSDMQNLYDGLLSGNVILLLDGCREALRIGIPYWEDRSVSEPISQPVIRGPMEAFTENIRTNTALIRRKIKDPRLWLESMQIGTVTKTNVGIMYVQGLAPDKVTAEVRRRLSAIRIDGVLEGGNIEEFIQDRTQTPFATVFNSERPDAIAAGLLEGRVAILVDGTPFVLLVPALFTQFFQSAEDYAQRADIGSLLRILRFLCLFIALLAPAFYVAITTFHQEMLPTSLLINLAAQREGVPFPAFIEALMMEITYEILREAGVRMPRPVGQAISIVGTLVIGQAAVEAGIVSAAMVIIVSITAISSFVIPNVSMSISVRMIRFLLMGLAASFGLYGIMIGILTLVLHLCSLHSFGVPYMSPIAPFELDEQKDTLFRIAMPRMRGRPRALAPGNVKRQRRAKR
ncbi:spore germination protein [Cohnella nanjingensis]|uniref:Spore germination protein n=1 Tax=Cohnella nanjingensis TaxID=1387779 RepID=A0A7X0RXB0_9BACL|nr:spore germination protein [Cohnella nanjingensis]MBB6675389.1 spore germination protein [Cohnella nanjingensis]